MANKYKKTVEEEPEVIPEPQPQKEEKKEPVAPKKRTINPRFKSIAKGYRDILGGDILAQKSVFKQLPFLMLLVLMMVLYIFNNNLAEKNLIKIEKTKKELIELRYEYISSKSDMMDSLNQSIVQQKLELLGIKEPTNPPHKIFINTGKSDKK